MKYPPAPLMLSALGVAVALISDLSLYAVLPVAYKQFGLVPWHVGLILSANRWVRLLCNHPAKWFAQVYPKYVGHHYSAALTVGMCCSLLYSIFPGTLWVMLIARCMWGMAWSVIRNSAMICVRLTVDSGKLQSGIATGWYDGISRIGAAIGLFVGGPLYDALSFSWLFGIWAGLSFLFIPLGYLSFIGSRKLIEESSTASTDQPSAPVSEPSHQTTEHRSHCHKVFLSVTKRQRLALSVVGFVTGCVSWGLIVSTLGVILKDILTDETTIFGVTIKIATINSVVLGTRWLCEVICTPMLGHLSDKIGRSYHSKIFFTIGLFACILCSFPLGVVAMLIGVMFFFLSASAVSVASLSEAVSSGSVASYFTMQDFGAAVGPILGYLLHSIDSVSPQTSIFLSAAILYAIGTVASFFAYTESPIAVVANDIVDVTSDRESIELVERGEFPSGEEDDEQELIEKT